MTGRNGKMTATVKSSAKSRKTAGGARRRTSAGKAAPFDRRKYATLLSRALPVVITTEAEYDQTIAEIDRLLRKDEANLSSEEDRLLDLLSTLAENWEETHHPIPEAPGHRILEQLHAGPWSQANRLATDPRFARGHIGDSQRQTLDHEGAG
jgi:hypothetical protein